MKAKVFPLLLCLCLLLVACSPGSTPAEDATATAATPEINGVNEGEQFSNRDRDTDTSGSVDILLEGSSATYSGKGVSVNDSTLTIESPGKYRLSGNLAGSIVVDVAKTDHVHLILDNTHITATDTAALYVKQAEKVVVTLNGENSLDTSGTFPESEDTNIDGTVFAKDDLSFNGDGSLSLRSPGHGIVCKDALVFYGGTYRIEAVCHAISTKDSLRMAEGMFTLLSGKDGIHTENEEDPAAVYLYITRSEFHITAAGDGISSGAALRIDSGDFTILAGGFGNADQHYDYPPGFPGYSQTTVTTEETLSTKGIKAVGNMQIYDGFFRIDAADDGIHSNGSLEIYGGDMGVLSGDDGIHAEERLLIQEGEIAITNCYEGLEGHCIDINGGTIYITASDDGLNAAGGNDGSGLDGREDIFAVDAEAYISIAGGQLTIDAQGDGIDSNGALRVSGGKTYISGPTNGGNGALDCNGDPSVTGGIFVACGSAGMAAGFGTNSTQGSIFLSYNTQPKGSKVTLTNASGEELLTWQTSKESSSIVISCPGILKGETYRLTVGSFEEDITMTDMVYGFSGGPGAPGGGPGGMPPQGGPGGPPPDGKPGRGNTN